jgi:hypothetical protein
MSKFWVFIDKWAGGVFRFMDKFSISRRAALYMTLWVTVDSYVWAKEFAETTTKSGLEVPGIIAAVLGGVTLLQGWVLKLYLGGKSSGGLG